MENIWIGQLLPENADDEKKVIAFARRFEEPAYGIYFYAKTPQKEVAGYTRANLKNQLLSFPDISLTNIISVDILQIDPFMQGKGIARKLIVALEEFTKNQGFDKIYVADSVNNSFWEHMGFKPVKRSLITLVKNLR